MAFSMKKYWMPATVRGDEIEVGPDCGLLGGEALFEGAAEVLLPLFEVELLAAEDETVVHRAHVGPLQRSVAEHVEDRAQHRTGLNVTDVVHADVPLVARPVEDVRVAAERVVALEDEHALARVAGEKGGGAEAADAGADDDGVVRLGA